MYTRLKMAAKDAKWKILLLNTHKIAIKICRIGKIM